VLKALAGAIGSVGVAQKTGFVMQRQNQAMDFKGDLMGI
jgi:hypothetical protein